jgi:nitric oxide reductase subunit B
VILMIAAIAGMIFFLGRAHEGEDRAPPKTDPLFDMKPTASMRATRKYFWVVIALVLAQAGMGIITKPGPASRKAPGSPVRPRWRIRR